MNKFLSNTNSEKIERILIIFVFLGLVSGYFFADESAMFIVPFIFQVFLLLFYVTLVKEKIHQVILGGMIIYVAGLIFNLMNWPYGAIMVYVGLVSYFGFGLLIIFKSIKETRKHNNFELLGFLLGIFLFVPAIMLFLAEFDDILKFYNFALAFVIGTIMYSDNLWDKYSTGEKKTIIYLLISALVIVANMSLKVL